MKVKTNESLKLFTPLPNFPYYSKYSRKLDAPFCQIWKLTIYKHRLNNIIIKKLSVELNATNDFLKHCTNFSILKLDFCRNADSRASHYSHVIIPGLTGTAITVCYLYAHSPCSCLANVAMELWRCVNGSSVVRGIWNERARDWLRIALFSSRVVSQECLQPVYSTDSFYSVVNCASQSAPKRLWN